MSVIENSIKIEMVGPMYFQENNIIYDAIEL